MGTRVVILTLNGEKYIENTLNKIDSSKYSILILDSSSTDDTIKICKRFVCDIKIISRSDFNHGATREMARNLVDTEIVVFLTQDAIPVDNTIELLITPIQAGRASASYARQIPRTGANIFEAFQRVFNYGSKPQVRSIKNVDKYGVYTFFCSNSCAAWSNTALDKIGGFKPTLTNEDYIACAELLIKGLKVAYVPEAKVIHSHKYSLFDEFRRMFDTGYVRAERPWIQEMVGNASKRGAGYFVALIKKLALENPFLIPYAFLQTTFKYIGYKIGFNALKFPKWLKKSLSGQKYYWTSKYYYK
jgi:rhamnosyltransferase